MSLGPMEIILILGIALLFFGPSRLPGLGKSVGEAIRSFKKGLSEDEEARDVKEAIPAETETRKQASSVTEEQKEKDKQS